MTRRRSVLIPAPLKPMIMELACAKANPAENIQTAKDTTSTAMLITLVLLEVILGMIKVVPDCANRRPAPPSTHYPARLYNLSMKPDFLISSRMLVSIKPAGLVVLAFVCVKESRAPWTPFSYGIGY